MSRPPIKEHLFKKIRSLLVKGKTKRAIELLHQIGEVDEYFVEKTINRLGQLKQDMALLTNEEYNSSIDRAVKDLFHHVEIREDATSVPSSRPSFSLSDFLSSLPRPSIKFPSFRIGRNFIITIGLISIAVIIWFMLPNINLRSTIEPETGPMAKEVADSYFNVSPSEQLKKESKGSDNEQVEEIIETEEDSTLTEDESQVTLDEEDSDDQENEEEVEEEADPIDTEEEVPNTEEIEQPAETIVPEVQEDSIESTPETTPEETKPAEPAKVYFDTFMVEKTLIPKVVDGFPNSRDASSSEYASTNQNPKVKVTFDNYESESGKITLLIDTLFDGSTFTNLVFEKQKTLDIKQDGKEFTLKFKKLGQVYPLVEITIIKKRIQ